MVATFSLSNYAKHVSAMWSRTQDWLHGQQGPQTLQMQKFCCPCVLVRALLQLAADGTLLLRKPGCVPCCLVFIACELRCTPGAAVGSSMQAWHTASSTVQCSLVSLVLIDIVLLTLQSLQSVVTGSRSQWSASKT